MSWVSINIFGTKAVLEVKENSETPQIADSTTPMNIIAKKDGQIVLVEGHKGANAVKEGDVVNHSYSTSRMNKPGIANNENPDCAPALTTRGDTLGVVVKEALPIKNATKKGYLLAEVGDAVDISGRMEYHRGTVQKGITQTITTSGGENVGVVVA